MIGGVKEAEPAWKDLSKDVVFNGVWSWPSEMKALCRRKPLGYAQAL